MHAARGNEGFRGFWLRGFWLRGLDAAFTEQAVTFDCANKEDLSFTVRAGLLVGEAQAAN
jgi:hypothetical protein